ncbi:related to 2-hydroxychromene-2-carboxylate isomerase [Lecanosticta acicola]|uniref:Glutathione S-transferase kappa n=1 Tax=Lecanosticta acicola TaxID=111012 RepID=A0AAI8YTG9_9PEZI|nr:related to 2-hydroxychromene-2-carboxylate isomerase [Lecanosticta acicola]
MDQVQRNPIGSQTTMPGSSKGKINLYVDIVSPFGYMAYWLTRNSPAFQGLDITYTPILLGGLMNATSNRPPLEITNKAQWINSERIRWTKAFRIPMAAEMPNPFPQPTVPTQRALCYISQSHPQLLAKALDALFHAFWVETKTIGKVDVIREALGKALGEQVAEDVVKGLGSEAAKKALKENSDQAFKDGAFGLPWFVATNGKGETEGFWGVDHIGQLLDFLGVEVKREGGYKAML